MVRGRMWRRFDPYDLSTYPTVNTLVQVRFSSGVMGLGQSKDFFPLSLRSTDSEIVLWRYLQ
jgi:hypothetical protein